MMAQLLLERPLGRRNIKLRKSCGLYRQHVPNPVETSTNLALPSQPLQSLTVDFKVKELVWPPPDTLWLACPPCSSWKSSFGREHLNKGVPG